MLKVCSCCLRSRAKSSYSPENWSSINIRRCKECAATNRQIQNPNIKGTFPLPRAGEGCRVFASNGVAEDIIPDSQGNLHLVLGGGKDVRNTCLKCGKEGSENCKLQHCARCKKIKYCSKKCQVDDWKRHKRDECIKKTAGKVQHMGVMKQDEESTITAFEKMGKGMEKAGEEGNRKLPSWDKYRGQNIGDTPTNQAQDMQKLALDFTLRFYLQLSSFAAYHIKRYHPLKGALFVFSKVSFFDLTDVPRDMTTITDSELDRMFAVSWGCLPVNGVTNRPHFSWLDLAGKFLNNAKTLPHYMENCCNHESFPLAICCDPSGGILPDLLNEHLRLPKNVDPVCYMDETPSITQVGPVRFFDFDSMLEFAGKNADIEAKFLNIDRDQDADYR